MLINNSIIEPLPPPKNVNTTKQQATAPAAIIPTKRPVDKVKVEENLNWASLLDEEEQEKMKNNKSSDSLSSSNMDTTDDFAKSLDSKDSSKWTVFRQHQKRQSEMEEKHKLLQKQKEEEKRQQALTAQFQLNEREMAKRQREEERQNKMNEDLDAEAFEKEFFN